MFSTGKPDPRLPRVANFIVAVAITKCRKMRGSSDSILVDR